MGYSSADQRPRYNNESRHSKFFAIDNRYIKPPVIRDRYSNPYEMNNQSSTLFGASKNPYNQEMSASRKGNNQNLVEEEGWITSPVVRKKSTKDTTHVNYGNVNYFQSLLRALVVYYSSNSLQLQHIKLGLL